VTRVDVAVIGAGPAGSAAGIALARAGYDVVVIDRQHTCIERIGEILPPSIRQPLGALGVWDAFLCAAPLPSVSACSLWGTDTIARRDFLFNPYGNGWHVDRQHFDCMLRNAAEQAGARLVLGAAFLHADRHPDGAWQLALASRAGNSSLAARFVIDASGRSRSFVRQRGAGQLRLDTMVACYAYLRTRPDAIVETIIEAHPDGWWYSAPLPGGRSVVSFLTDASSVASCRGEALAARIPGAIATQLAAVPADTRFRNVAADSARLRVFAAEGWIAAGDAAATHDPLAAQGIDRALRSGMRAAEAAALTLQGRSGSLAAYAAVQQASFDAYVRTRRAFYAMEQRWGARPFWAQRGATTRPAAGP
jgi:flavin-dependent dehydrogenase